MILRTQVPTLKHHPLVLYAHCPRPSHARSPSVPTEPFFQLPPAPGYRFVCHIRSFVRLVLLFSCSKRYPSLWWLYPTKFCPVHFRSAGWEKKTVTKKTFCQTFAVNYQNSRVRKWFDSTFQGGVKSFSPRHHSFIQLHNVTFRKTHDLKRVLSQKSGPKQFLEVIFWRKPTCKTFRRLAKHSFAGRKNCSRLKRVLKKLSVWSTRASEFWDV